MKAIFIDAVNRKVEKIDFNYNGDISMIQEKIGCSCFTAVGLETGQDAVYVDDEGAINGTNDYFFIKGHHQPYAGNGLILGCDNEGYSTDAECFDSFDPDTVKFMDRDELALMVLAFQIM